MYINIYFLICSIMNTIRLIQQILFVLLNQGNLTIVLFSNTANLVKKNLIHLGFNKFKTFQKDLIKIILYCGKLKLYCTGVASSDFKFFTKSKKKFEHHPRIILQYYNSISHMNSQKILKFQKSEDIIGTDSQPHWSFYIHQLKKTHQWNSQDTFLPSLISTLA